MVGHYRTTIPITVKLALSFIMTQLSLLFSPAGKTGVGLVRCLILIKKTKHSPPSPAPWPNKIEIQAGDELCQAQEKLGLAKLA